MSEGKPGFLFPYGVHEPDWMIGGGLSRGKVIGLFDTKEEAEIYAKERMKSDNKPYSVDMRPISTDADCKFNSGLDKGLLRRFLEKSKQGEKMKKSNMEKLQKALSDGISGVKFDRGCDLLRGEISGKKTIFADIMGHACLLSLMEKGKSPDEISRDRYSRRFGSVRGKAMHWLGIGETVSRNLFCDVAGSPELENGKDAAAHVKATVEWFGL